MCYLGLSLEGGKGCAGVIKLLGKIESALHFRSPAELNFSLNAFCTHHITRTCRHKWSPGKYSVTCLATSLFADCVTSGGANDFYFAVIEWPVTSSHILYTASLVLFKQGPKAA
jgi:hypothetical protein